MNSSSQSKPCADAGAHIPRSPEALDYYDTGLLSDYGGGDVDWWWTYIRTELDRAHEFYSDQLRVPDVNPYDLAAIDRAREVVRTALQAADNASHAGEIAVLQMAAALEAAREGTRVAAGSEAQAQHRDEPDQNIDSTLAGRKLEDQP